MAELFRTRCSQGFLVITEDFIRVELAQLRQQTLYRQSLTGVDLKVTVQPIKLLGMKGAATLVFHGGMEVFRVDMVSLPIAREIVGLLQRPQQK